MKTLLPRLTASVLFVVPANAMAAQLGKHTFGIPRVIAKINDPVRAEARHTMRRRSSPGAYSRMP